MPDELWNSNAYEPVPKFLSYLEKNIPMMPIKEEMQIIG